MLPQGADLQIFAPAGKEVMTVFSEHLRQLGFKPHPYRSSRLKSYYSRMSKDRNDVIYDDNVAAMLQAQGFSIDPNPRSIYSVDKLYEALEGYSPKFNAPPECSTSFDRGISLAYSSFARPKDFDYLEPLAMTPAVVKLVTSNHSGSAGLTNYGHSKAESETRALERGIQTLIKGKAPEPCLAFSRTQFNEKTRLVWGYPYSMTVIEGLLAHPLIQMFKEGRTPMAFAMPTITLGTNLRISSYHKEWVYSLDMSQFDATISSFLIRKAFRILGTWFDLDRIEPTTGLKYSAILNVIQEYFIHTPIVMPDGNVYYGKNHGVPSGSYFTQMIDSIVNVIIIGSIADKFHLNLDKKDVYVLGDDILFFSCNKVSLDDIALYAKRAFGVKMHGSEKSTLTRFNEPIHFLGRTWVNGLPDIDEQAIISRMVYPERFRVRSDDPVKRQKEVHYLLLSYAAVYRSAWKIAAKSMGLSERNLNRGLGPVSVMLHSTSTLDVNPDHLSGLLRYQWKYVKTESVDDLVLQYWM